MIVNLYADHLAQTPPQSAEDVWQDVRTNPVVYSQAAALLGLSSKEYAEFQQRLLDGDAIYTRLPRHVDAMAGNHHGHVYAIRNAQMTSSVLGWRVKLHDGKTIYIPQTCGNLSVVEPTYVSIPVRVATPTKTVTKIAAVPYVPTLAQVAPAPVVVSEAPSYPDSIPAPPPQPSGLYAIPIIGGIIYGVTHLGGWGYDPSAMLRRIELGVRMPKVKKFYERPWCLDPKLWTSHDWLLAIQKLVNHFNCWGYCEPGERHDYTYAQERRFQSDLFDLVFASETVGFANRRVSRDCRKVIKWLRDV